MKTATAGVLVRQWSVSVATISLVVAGCAAPASSTPSATTDGSSHPTASMESPALHPTGRIVFERLDAESGSTAVYVANADGTDVQELFARGAEMPHWSPDARIVSIFCCDNGNAAHLVDVATGDFKEFASPDSAIEAHCGPWSADGAQLLCEGFGVDDSKLNGVYAIRSSDGKALARLTSDPNGDDLPGSFSPDGSHMVFTRIGPGDNFALFVTDFHGTVKRITEFGSVDIGFFGRYSPDGSLILFASALDGGIWVVRPDGSDLHELFRDDAGRFSVTPTWSPDGSQIMFALSSSVDLSSHPPTGMYVIDASGQNLTEVLPPDIYQANPDWTE
jgi:Tol biopolymer transport system component